LNADRAPQLKRSVGHLLSLHEVRIVTVLSRTLSPTVLLYSFVVITELVYGLYLGQQSEAPAAYTLLHWAAQLWIIGWWLRTDSRKRGVVWVYDLGFFLFIAWPLVMPYYLVKTRGAKGLLVILGFIGVYVGATIVGIILSVTFAVLRG
jgi:polyferredoxin